MTRLGWVAIVATACAAIVAGCGGSSASTTSEQAQSSTTTGQEQSSTTNQQAPADVPSYLEVVKEAAEAKAEGKLPQNLEPGESEGAEGPAGGDCLAFVKSFTTEQIETLLGLVQRQVEAGGSEPAPGTCGAERLEWMREQVE